MRGQDNKEIEMPTTTTLVYNLPNKENHINSSNSSSKLSPPTLGQTSDQPAQTHHTLIFSDPSQTSQSHNHHLYSPSPLPPNPLQSQQPPPHRPKRDPDPSSSSSSLIATTNITSSTPIVTISNPPRTTTPLIRYRECLKNHAASMGGHVTDGCGEFMPSGEEGTPQYLICAACECHRNFHRKDVFNYYPNNKSNGLNNRINSPPPHLLLPTPPNSLVHHHHHRLSPHGVPMVPFAGGPAESSSGYLNMFDGSVQPSKKRFRTKFTQQQKDSMMEFAEKLGWKIQKQDEVELERFCSQVGLNRQAFKVWMHNSKQAMKKKHM